MEEPLVAPEIKQGPTCALLLCSRRCLASSHVGTALHAREYRIVDEAARLQGGMQGGCIRYPLVVAGGHSKRSLRPIGLPCNVHRSQNWSMLLLLLLLLDVLTSRNHMI